MPLCQNCQSLINERAMLRSRLLGAEEMLARLPKKGTQDGNLRRLQYLTEIAQLNEQIRALGETEEIRRLLLPAFQALLAGEPNQ